MLVYRMEHPTDQRGPFRPLLDPLIEIGMAKPPSYSLYSKESDLDEFITEVKGETYKGGRSVSEKAPSPGHEVDEALRRGDRDRIAKFREVSMDSTMSDYRNAPTDLLYGTADPQQFVRWFTPRAQEIAAKYGYKQAVYEVPDDHVAPLYTQVAFKRKDARLVEYRALAA